MVPHPLTCQRGVTGRNRADDALVECPPMPGHLAEGQCQHAGSIQLIREHAKDTREPAIVFRPFNCGELSTSDLGDLCADRGRRWWPTCYGGRHRRHRRCALVRTLRDQIPEQVTTRETSSTGSAQLDQLGPQPIGAETCILGNKLVLLQNRQDVEARTFAQVELPSNLGQGWLLLRLAQQGQGSCRDIYRGSKRALCYRRSFIIGH